MSTLWRLAAQHQIDLERLVHEGRVVDVLLDLLLERQNEARPHQPFERLLINLIGRVLQARPLAQTEGLVDRGRVVAPGVADRQVRQAADQLVDRQQARIGDRSLLDERSGGGGIVGDAALRRRDERLVSRVAHPPEPEHAEGRERDEAEDRDANRERTANGGDVGRHPAGFAEDHLGHQVMEKIALARA